VALSRASTEGEEETMKIHDLIFVGLNGRIAALDRSRGEIIWQWRSPKPQRGYVNILLDRNLLIAGVNGYIYGLDPKTGEQLWFNELKGYGLGVTSIATVGGATSLAVVLQAAAADEAAAASAAATTPM
jgi:outer membrane protein assembly factor BamB